MALFKDTVAPAQPSLEERVNAAAATAAFARNAFEAAASDLENAAHEQAQIRDAALAEAERLNDLALAADDECIRNAEAASKIRALVA
ncbi:hypothetical protein [Micromonospora sp. CB01531]|uniref:hypothetical protein n=1 Tax=Micromonospora sp. CB01531 TaxID=1718947 RepID=UPI00093FD46F|nr:hypothetical protein [Micromonospora sp. CB01531]OKI45126.1 hypothetical protein A6A27_11985 [Micromonospora sp. CB01531]